jgi:hypothetical protein
VRLSVVVTIVDAGDALERCLTALAAQRNAPDLEVVVPWDDTVAGVTAMAARFPACRFLPLGPVATSRRSDSAAGQHELFDRRRAAGLAAATGDVVAILEDRGAPRTDWAATMARLHTELPHAVIGGAIENGRTSLLNWAVYFCDFGRYHLPFAAGPRAWVSDVNIGYKRRALDATRDLWRDRYHETTVHWALERAGETLYLSPELAVDEMRDGLSLGRVLGERMAWGRLFAYTRAREVSWAKRLAWAALTPVLPLVLLARHVREQSAKRQTFARFLSASPLVLLLLASWSLGEAIGYVTRHP